MLKLQIGQLNNMNFTPGIKQAQDLQISVRFTLVNI